MRQFVLSTLALVSLLLASSPAFADDVTLLTVDAGSRDVEVPTADPSIEQEGGTQEGELTVANVFGNEVTVPFVRSDGSPDVQPSLGQGSQTRTIPVVVVTVYVPVLVEGEREEDGAFAFYATTDADLDGFGDDERTGLVALGGSKLYRIDACSSGTLAGPCAPNSGSLDASVPGNDRAVGGPVTLLP